MHTKMFLKLFESQNQKYKTKIELFVQIKKSFFSFERMFHEKNHPQNRNINVI